jgi:hypothetical protein
MTATTMRLRRTTLGGSWYGTATLVKLSFTSCRNDGRGSVVGSVMQGAPSGSG